MIKLLMSGAAALAIVIAIAPTAAQPIAPPPGVSQGTAPLATSRPAPHVQSRIMAMPDSGMTRHSVASHVAQMFGMLDANRDGFITKDEVAAFHQRMIAMRAGTGHGTAEPGMKMPNRAAMFDRLDANHDGSLSRQEYMAARPQIREQRMVVLRGDGAMPGMPDVAHMKMHMRSMGARGMRMRGMGGHMFEMADANHDGRVSLAEAQALALAHFDRADADHDGRITPDERRQAHGAMRQRRPS